MPNENQKFNPCGNDDTDLFEGRVYEEPDVDGYYEGGGWGCTDVDRGVFSKQAMATLRSNFQPGAVWQDTEDCELAKALENAMRTCQDYFDAEYFISGYWSGVQSRLSCSDSEARTEEV